ncbi:hypothetical protein ABTX86_31970, partial [Streptomyces anulatus]
MKTENATPTDTVGGTGSGTPAPPDRHHDRARRADRADLVAAAAGVLLVTAAVVVGHVIQNRDGSLRAQWPPLLASWDPHLGPGTPAALIMAVLVVAHGPTLAARLPWRGLLA